MLEAIARTFFGQLFIAWLLLVLGDFLSTFCYHVPEHVFGRLHLQTHHSAKKTFRHYAILTANLQVLLDGLLGALPYLLMAVALWSSSPIGVVGGLLFGQFHVWWRHVSALSWQTPKPITFLCQVLFITTPEQHWLHHQKTNTGFGDIFTFFDQPARAWMRFLRWLRLYRRYLPV
ncbi:MAG: sterol desaturase family protein [Stenomitos rutilans HA7619-LM2]|jgi:hypothetical protein|nr:sterol desaturase family protein [Stenomitos rutilans HA7619-LM2]